MTEVGLRVEDLDTPALLVDLEALERNIRRMADFFASVPANLRPHVKTHKTPAIAHKQIAAGAQGITCAKLGEAEVMAAAGIDDILIANQVVGPAKIARLMGLARQISVTVAVDNPQNVADLSAAATAAGATVGVLVEVNVGMNRCGVAPGEAAVALAQQVARSPGLRFRGVMGYEGHCVAIPDRREREEKARAAMALLIATKEMIEAAGLPVEVVSGGGTGTFDITGRYPGVTEVQAGSYVTMDTSYRRLDLGFECALTVLTTVISRPQPGLAIVDAGMKAITPEFGMPEPKGLPGARVVRLSEEHGKIELADGGLSVGDKLELIPSHGCTTFNLHDRLYAVRAGRVEAVWPIAGRGQFR